MREFLNSYEKLEFDKVKNYIHRHALSDLGREHVEELTPSSDPEVISVNLARVSEMKRLLEEDDHLPIENISDTRTSLHRSTIEGYILSSEELYKIAALLATSKSVHVYFTRRTGSYSLLELIGSRITLEKILEYNITQAIDEEGKVKDSASKELSLLRKQIIEQREALKRNLVAILRLLAGKDWTQEDIITTRDGRMVIPVKVEHKNRVPGFIHSASASGATVFIEPTETLELNNGIRTLQFQEQKEIDRILRMLTHQVREKREQILQNIQILGELDFICSKAKYSIEIIGIEPIVKLEGSLRLINCTHPVLLQCHGRKAIVPLNLERSPKNNTLIITGPNAGGKSVAMKTVGILAIMTQAGCHIPAASGTELPIFTEVFLDIGDDQSIENDLSSFSSHLRNLNVILQHANQSSLVLIDEIGSGTDPVEGSSLAAAVIEDLTKRRSTNIVTTHHGSLKTFAYENEGIQNGSMEFDQATLKPTYRFRSGIPGSSYAIEMAERMNLPKEVLIRSRELKGSDANKLERLIMDLESQSLELKKNLDPVRADKIHLDTSNQLYQQKIAGLETELKSIKLKAINEAEAIIQRANILVENSIREIRESNAQAATIRKVQQELKQLELQIDGAKEELVPSQEYDFEVGEGVRLVQTSTVGEIVSILEHDQYLVLVGELKVKIHKKELEPFHNSKAPAPREHSPLVNSKEVKREIDLRGMYGEEAIGAIDKFIDDAVMAGFHRIDIIHGKGTGALRKKIAEHLKGNKTIKSFRLGEWNEGGSGVTVIDLE